MVNNFKYQFKEYCNFCLIIVYIVYLEILKFFIWVFFLCIVQNLLKVIKGLIYELLNFFKEFKEIYFEIVIILMVLFLYIDIYYFIIFILKF